MTSAPRPAVTLKLATSLDGRIATALGESKWITGEAARQEVHRLRAAHDAVLVGSQTVLDDDPELTVRLPGYTGPQPLRVVADARGRIRKSAKLRLFSSGLARLSDVLVVRSHDFETSSGGSGGVLPEGAKFVAPAEGVALEWLLDVISMEVQGLRRMAEIDRKERRASDDRRSPLPLPTERPEHLENIRVLLEGGGKLAASFLRADLIDRIEWFRAPIILGGDGRPALATLELAKLADAPRFKRLDVKALGDDLWERYERLRE